MDQEHNRQTGLLLQYRAMHYGASHGENVGKMTYTYYKTN